MKKLVILFSLFFFGCHYHTDKLKVYNNSKKDIHYLPMVKDRNSGNYYALSVGGNIKPMEYDSPKLRGSISDYMKQKEFDNLLYVIFFKEKYFKYAPEDGKKIVYDKRFKVQKYSLKELDSLNWNIEYKGN